MKNTLLGRARPLAVRSVGLGCMGMVSAYPPIPDKKDMIRFTREAVDQGATFLDTAEVYGPYTSEEILGQALEGIRDPGGHRHEIWLCHPKRPVRWAGQPPGLHPQSCRGFLETAADRPHRPALPAPGRPQRPGGKGGGDRRAADAGGKGAPLGAK